jgi:DNA repair protein RecN (Recombination protein N)
LILGSRADTSVLLDKKEKCIVEGTFKVDGYDLEEFFADNDLDFESVAILRREINQAGKSRGFINDTPVTVNLMKELGDRLIDIHSQHQMLMLNESSFQLNIIDSFAGTSSLRNDYRAAYSDFRKLQREYLELKEKSEKNKADLEYYQFQLNQIDEAKLKIGEQEELEREQELLAHAGEIRQSLTYSSQLLSQEDRSVITLLGELRVTIGKISSFLSGDENIPGRLNSVYIELDDIANEIDRLAQKIDSDPQRLEKINNRLDNIYSLIQKHRVKDLGELLLKKEEIEGIIRAIGTSDDRLTELESLLKSQTVVLAGLSDKISKKRKSILADTEKRITESLKQLGMPNAKFRISLSGTKDFTPSGIDAADFMFSANKQTEPENITKVASGGELSRVMLSLKSMLTKNINLPTIIFDEIDSGVSGEVADKVGQILSDMGKYMQVVNITHLPQVASRGTKHFHVYKEETEDSTITRIRLLSESERVLEVARLLSGSEITETAIKNASELINAGLK